MKDAAPGRAVPRYTTARGSRRRPLPLPPVVWRERSAGLECVHQRSKEDSVHT